jgi:peptidyl-tRNA hydrolase, PTH1 family
MFYIVALGNPGEEYAHTRHNVGWLVLDYFIEKFQLPTPVESKPFSGKVSGAVVEDKEVTLLYPSTFMNNSGSAVVKLVPKGEIDSLVVIHDDIDLPLGAVKIGKGRGAGGNQGVQSIIDALGTKEFIRVRIGIAPKSFWTGLVTRPSGGGPLERFVLKPFTRSEQKQVAEVCELASSALSAIVKEGVEQAMNKYN